MDMDIICIWALCMYMYMDIVVEQTKPERHDSSISRLTTTTTTAAGAAATTTTTTTTTTSILVSLRL